MCQLHRETHTYRHKNVSFRIKLHKLVRPNAAHKKKEEEEREKKKEVKKEKEDDSKIVNASFFFLVSDAVLVGRNCGFQASTTLL